MMEELEEEADWPINKPPSFSLKEYKVAALQFDFVIFLDLDYETVALYGQMQFILPY